MHNFKKLQYEGLDRFLLANYITLALYISGLIPLLGILRKKITMQNLIKKVKITH